MNKSTTDNAPVTTENYPNLLNNISNTLESGRSKAFYAINNILISSYWQIGQYIVEFEQKGQEHSQYGSELIDRLAKDLTLKYGKGFGRSNLRSMRALFLNFPIQQTLSVELSWSHYLEILKADNELERQFYIKQCENEKWSVRELKRQIKSMLFHRLALSKDKAGVLKLAENGLEIAKSEDIIKDPYVLEFLDIKQEHLYNEKMLEKNLIDNLQHFLLELGKGFAFIGRQYRISIAGKHFYVDLVFYHRILKCFVLIDLKLGEIEHNDIGQMNFYLNYFKKEENTEGDNEPIGIVLGSKKDEITVEYAIQNISNQLFVSKYQLYLPEKEKLQKELNKLLSNENISE